MKSKYVIFKIILFFSFIGYCNFHTLANSRNSIYQDTISAYNDSILRIETEYNERYAKRLMQFEQAWRNIIPAYSKIQYAGNMGMFSFGIGWQYGKNEQWETDILFGFIPKHQSKNAKLTMTLKLNFTPWKLHENKYIFIEPFSCGLYLNSVFSDEFWNNAPDKYPNGYYWFSTKIRTNVFIGQRITFNIPLNKRVFARSITLFYEISTHDFAIIQAIKNSRLTPKDYLTFSLGTKFQWL